VENIAIIIVEERRSFELLAKHFANARETAWSMQCSPNKYSVLAEQLGTARGTACYCSQNNSVMLSGTLAFGSSIV
jgi:hypothetical protein